MGFHVCTLFHVRITTRSAWSRRKATRRAHALVCAVRRLGRGRRGCALAFFDNLPEDGNQNVAGLLTQHRDFRAAAGNRTDVGGGDCCRELVQGLP